MSFFKSQAFKAYRFPILLLLAMIIGSGIGIWFGEDANILKPIGDIFVNMMFMIVVPLVFFTISSSVANMVSLKRLGKILKNVFLVFVITSFISAVIMLIVVLIIDPVGNANIILENAEIIKVNIGEKIVQTLTVTDFSQLLSKSNMLPLIIFSIIFGICVSSLGEKGKVLKDLLNNISLAMMKFVKIIMYMAPIGILAYFASLIGEFGPNLLGSYARSMAIYYILCVVYFFTCYTLFSYISGGKKGVKTFYKNIFSPSLTSIATQSSLASLPSNLEAASKIGVAKDIREVTLPVGATMHMEGSSMGSILKIVFLFGIFGRNFVGIDTFVIAIFISILSGVVMSGIPGGGLIGEMLIVSLYGFPAAAFPIIATIGWLIDPPATWINVTGDITSSMLVSRLVEGKNWLNNKLKKE